MKIEEYGEVVNHQDTFEDIAAVLKQRGSCVIGWTDEDSTHLDILFATPKGKGGTLQRGIKCTDLFVSIMGIGAFGFDIHVWDTHESYFSEKFRGLGSNNSTTRALAELINGVRKQLV